MTIPQRIKLVMVLAGLFYICIIAAGMGGMTLGIWSVAVVIFFVWHLLLHDPAQGRGWAMVVAVHGAVAALFLGIGHGLGALTGAAPRPEYAFGAALLVTGLARMVNVTPEQTAGMARIAEETAAQIEERRRALADAVPGLTEAERKAVREILDDLRALPASGALPADLEPIVARLHEAGPPLQVLERLERTSDGHLPNVQAHAAFALSPASARDVSDIDALEAALDRALATDAPLVVAGAAQAAARLIDALPDAARFMPEPDALLKRADRLESRDTDAADALRALAERVAGPRDD